ncbi:MAG: pyroglutamyl-peptidase I [Chloroflexi bacterium]|nr:pyroglutamyl-peptidase I [Chloroflexota bacterium]
MKILVTGFTPFGGQTINVSWKAVKRLPDKIDGVEICKMEIPTVFGKSADTILEFTRRAKPRAVIVVGEAGGRKYITPERVAINVDDARMPDNNGQLPVDRPIVKGAREAYFTTLPVRKIIEAIDQVGVPVQISNSAGTYVCNHVMYRLLHEANMAQMPFLTGFIHLPYCEEQVVGKDDPALPLQDICRGLEAGVRVVVEAVLEREH